MIGGHSMQYYIMTRFNWFKPTQCTLQNYVRASRITLVSFTVLSKEAEKLLPRGTGRKHSFLTPSKYYKLYIASAYHSEVAKESVHALPPDPFLLPQQAKFPTGSVTARSRIIHV
jgi:hypothetical protein